MKNTDSSKGHSLPNKMEIDLHMFGPLVMNGICGQIHNTDIITIYKSGTCERTVKLTQELTNPASLSNNISNTTIFGFSTRP